MTESQIESYNKQEKDLLKRFTKMSFFSFFDSFDEIQKFLKLLLLFFFILTMIFAALCTKLYIEVHDKTAALVRETHAVAIYLTQQKIVSLQTFGVRIAAEYWSMSHYNAESFRENLIPFLHHSRAADLLKVIETQEHMLRTADIVQQVTQIEYSKLHVVEEQPYNGHPLYYVSIPMTVTAYKEGMPKRNIESFTYGLYLVAASPTLSNPLGLYILKMGKVQESDAL